MIDWIKIFVASICYDSLKKHTGIQFSALTDLATGDLKGKKNRRGSGDTYVYTGHYQHYSLKVLETHRLSKGQWELTYNLIIQGSLHKNSQAGANHQRFSFLALQKEIENICNGLSILPVHCRIQNIEIGANIKPHFPIASFINHELLMHSTIPLMEYSASRYQNSLGKHAKHSQHSFKCYNKGLQYRLPYNLMRVEVRCLKMQFLSKYGINTLEDLKSLEKVKVLCEVVLKGWDQVLLCDPEIDLMSSSISHAQRTLLNDGDNRDYWIRLHTQNPKKFYKLRTKFKTLTKKYSNLDKHAAIRVLLVRELEDMLGIGSFLPYTQTANHKGDILTYPIKGKSIPMYTDHTIKPTDQSDQSNLSDLSNPSLSTPSTTNDQETIALYIPHEATQEQNAQQSDSTSAVEPSMPLPVNLSDSSTSTDTMKQQKHLEATTAGKPYGKHESADEYIRAKGNGIGTLKAAIQKTDEQSTSLNWYLNRFLTKQ